MHDSSQPCTLPNYTLLQDAASQQATYTAQFAIEVLEGDKKEGIDDIHDTNVSVGLNKPV